MRLICSILLLFSSCCGVFAQGEFIWAKNITRSWSYSPEYVFESYPSDIHVDTENQVYITGSYQGILFDSDCDTLNYNDDNIDSFVAKLNTNGDYLWMHHFEGTGADSTYSVTTDNDLNCYVAGSYTDSLIIDGDLLVAETAFSLNWPRAKLFVVKFDAQGNLLWHFTPTVAEDRSHALDIEVDDDQNCYVVGDFKEDLTLGSFELNTNGNGNFEAALIFKLDANGEPVWAKHWKGYHDYDYGGFQDDLRTQITQVCKAPDGDIYIGGSFKRFMIMTSGDSIFTVSGELDYQDAFVSRMDSDGNIDWMQTHGMNYPTSEGRTSINCLESDEDGMLYVAGMFHGGNGGNTMDLGGNILTTGWTTDIYYSKFNPSGDCLWAHGISGPNTIEYPVDLKLDRDNNFWITSQASQSMGFVNETVTGIPIGGAYNSLIDGSNGNMLRFERTYPILQFSAPFSFPEGRYPRLEIDSYGNRFFYGNADGSTVQGLDCSHWDGLYIAKQSSGDIHLSGRVFHDEDEDGVIDSLETFLPYIIIDGDSGTFYRTTDLSGQFGVSVDSMVHTLSPIIPQYWQPTFPLNPNQHQTGPFYASDSITDLHFGMTMIPGIDDIRITLAATGAVPGFGMKITAAIENIGTTLIPNGTIALVYDDTLTFDSTSVQFDTHLGDTLIWSYDSLDVGQTQYVKSWFTVPPEPELLGEELFNYADVFPMLTDTNALDNSDTLYVTITGSFDPNYKANDPPGIGEEGYITQLDTVFEYEIHFQNTGTDTAINVVLVDSISDLLKITSFDMLMASHDYTYEITGPGVITWTFENIMLPDSGANYVESQGFVKFIIHTEGQHPEGTVFENEADIYFDFNPPITTEPKINTIFTCPVLHIAVEDETICLGDALEASIEDDGISAYSWNIDSFYNEFGASVYWTSDTVGSFTLLLNRSNPLCPMAPDTTLAFIVDSVPVVSVGSEPNIPACENDQFITLPVPSPLGGVFTGPTVSGNEFSPLNAGVGVHEVIYTYTSPTGAMCAASDTLTIEVSNCLSVNLINGSSEINAFPNPTTGSLTVIGEGQYSCELLDVKGRAVYRGNGEGQTTIDMEHLTAGIYTLIITKNENRTVSRIVKQ